jgi:hypothetical protein
MSPRRSGAIQAVPAGPQSVTRRHRSRYVVFGWQYWRRGLVAAMAAHLGADIVLHVLSPLLVVSP